MLLLSQMSAAVSGMGEFGDPPSLEHSAEEKAAEERAQQYDTYNHA